MPIKLLRAIERAPLVPEETLGRSFGYAQIRRRKREVLTPAETQVLQYLSYGLTAPQIADARGTQYVTVKTQIKQIFKVLRAKTSAQAVAEGIRRGIIS